MDFLVFFLYIVLFAFILRCFYIVQRKFFNSSYYSFYELITGLPTNLSFNQLFFIRFLPPFIIAFIAHKLLGNFYSYNLLTYSLIGIIAALINIIPALIDIKLYKGKDYEKLRLKHMLKSLYVIYFFYLTSFALTATLGAYFSSIISYSDLLNILPSKQGMIDGLWIALILAIFKLTNKPL